MSLSYEAMMFAREVHKDQKRKYTGAPYFDHLAEAAADRPNSEWHEACFVGVLTYAVEMRKRGISVETHH